MQPMRQMPSSPDAEKQVLGWLLNGQTDAHDVLSVLRAEDFHDKKHEKIYETIADLHKAKKRVDLVTVSARMEALGLSVYLAAVEGDAYLSALAIECSYAPLETIVEYAKMIVDASRRRALIIAAEELKDRAYRGADDSGTIAEQTQATLGSLCDRSHAKTPRPLREVIHEAVRELERRYQNKSAITGVPSGLRDLDDLTHGWQYSELTIIGARPSMGKTALVMQSAIHGAEMGHPGLIFTLEMAEREIGMRTISNSGQVDGRAMKTGYLQATEWVKITKAVQRLAGLPIHIDDDSTQTIDAICSKARRWKRDPQVFQRDTKGGFVVLDFLQLVNSGITRKNTNREQEVTYVTRQLKALAKELGVAVIALASLNRALEARSDKRPIAADLRDSGNIESDADSILMLYRDEVYNPETEDKGIMELLMRKARNSEVGEKKVKWVAQSTRFEDIE